MQDIIWLSEQVRKKLLENQDLYNQFLVLLTDRKKDFQLLSQQLGADLIDINILVSEQLLEVPNRLRALKVQQVVSNVIKQAHRDTIIIDNFELLFEPSLKTKPIDLFRELSKYKEIILIWRYGKKKERLIYAVPDHPEYQESSIRESEFIIY